MKTALLGLLLVLALGGAVPAQSWTPVQSLREARIVFLGENHTRAADHQGQLAALKGLAALDDRPLIVAAEMFTERARDELKDGITPELWKREWGHPYPLYAEIFEWMNNNRVALADLRPDPAFTESVKTDGPIACLPRLGELTLGPLAYYEYMHKIAADHGPPDGKPDRSMVDRFFLVQCFWDEYMAWRLMSLAEQYPDARIAVLVGSGHLHPEWGIPWRISRRRPDLPWLTVVFNRDLWEIADFVLEPPAGD